MMLYICMNFSRTEETETERLIRQLQEENAALRAELQQIRSAPPTPAVPGTPVVSGVVAIPSTSTAPGTPITAQLATPPGSVLIGQPGSTIQLPGSTETSISIVHDGTAIKGETNI